MELLHKQYSLNLEFQSGGFQLFPLQWVSRWWILTVSDSPGLKSLLLEGCSHHTTDRQRWPCSSDRLWGVLQPHQNPAWTVELRQEATTFKALIFGRSIKTSHLTLSLSNGSRTISVPEQWVLFLRMISAVCRRKCHLEITDSIHLISAKRICHGQT